MKNLLKTLLLMFVLLGYAKRVRRYLFPDTFTKKYGKFKRYVLKSGSIKVIYDTADRYSKKWFYPRYDNGKIHEPITTELFIQYITKQDCVFDIGSHLGYFACLAGVLTPQGEVHAFEVDPKCIPLIEKNLKINKLKNVTVNNYAVSDRNGFEKIPSMNNPDPRLKINGSISGFKEIPAIQIDDYVRKKNVSPTLVKIDVEGAEWKVLNGMQNVLDKDDIKLLIEVHVETLAAEFNTDFKNILRLLEIKGFCIEEIESHRLVNSDFRKVNGNSELKGNTMLFCSKTTSPFHRHI